jgi:hypothetical protein
MNLYELAESLDSWANDVYGGGKTITDAANMLRQQQNEIEDLKSANRFIQNFAEEQHQKAVALEIRELTDEEIKDFIFPQFVFEDGGIGMPLDEFLATVRAILRKAQEK